MSFGSLSAPGQGGARAAAPPLAGTSTTTGDGGMTEEERGHSKTLVYQYLPSRYGMNPDDLRRADAIEIVVGQGAKPGGGGMLLGQKISDRVAEMRTLPKGIDQRSACRHPDWTGPDDLEIKILELREITDWEKPIYVKVGGARPYYDTALAVKAGADVVVLDGMQGGTAATQDVFIEHVGLPTLACHPPGGAGAAGSRHAPQGAADRLRRHPQRRRRGQGAGARRRRGLDRHRGAGRARRQRPAAARTSTASSAPPPAPTTTGTRAATRPASPRRTRSLPQRLDPVAAGRRLANYLKVMTLEAQTIARACGKNHVHNLEPEDLVRADRRGRRHGAGAAGRHRLDPGQSAASDDDIVTQHETAPRSTQEKGESTWRPIWPHVAKKNGVKYFLISFTDLFGGQRAKLVPAAGASPTCRRTAPASPASPPGST